MSEKYKHACTEYAKASAEVRRISRVIGNALSACAVEQIDAYAKDYPNGYFGEPNIVNHLKLAYEMDKERDGCGRYEKYFVNHEDDVEGYLLEQCPHCYTAHMAIQERKKARQVLGVAKRRISFLGKLGQIKGMKPPKE